MGLSRCRKFAQPLIILGGPSFIAVLWHSAQTTEEGFRPQPAEEGLGIALSTSAASKRFHPAVIKTTHLLPIWVPACLDPKWPSCGLSGGCPSGPNQGLAFSKLGPWFFYAFRVLAHFRSRFLYVLLLIDLAIWSVKRLVAFRANTQPR
jgi:hypothetical protein